MNSAFGGIYNHHPLTQTHMAKRGQPLPELPPLAAQSGLTHKLGDQRPGLQTRDVIC